MVATDTDQAASYELPLPEAGQHSPGPGAGGKGASLPAPLLLDNVLWFCRLRWTVIGMLVIFALAGFFPGVFERVGLRSYVTEPLVIAAVLVLTNLCFLAHARRLRSLGPVAGARANLWVQIVSDLLVLTAVVHYLGSLETYAAFAYLFHIVLACIFLSRTQSLLVVAIAGTFYVACVALEETGNLPPAGVYGGAASLREYMKGMAGHSLLSVGSAFFVWLVVWHLASHLSAMVRERDRELAETNRRLLAAQQERTRHMLRTTHELKAPFAAIHANAQLLLRGHCGVLSDEALDVVRRIARRCSRLATEIQEMLQLANLRSSSEQPTQPTELDLAEVVGWAISQVSQTAEARGVAIGAELEPAPIVGVQDHLRMLLANLLSNAVAYSQEGGRVAVRCCAAAPGDDVLVSVEDHGIGIAPEKLPRIFEEYYRTDEAARHNKESTGLGLAIVQHVALEHGIRVRVESTLKEGTRFTLGFPRGGQPAGMSRKGG